MLSVLVFIVGFILLFLVGLAVSYSTIKEIILLRRTPAMKINALPTDGLVQVVGTAAQETVTSPISQRNCAVWQVEVQEKQLGRGDSRWSTISKKTSSTPFELCDETGKVWVDLTGADLILRQEMEKGGWVDPGFMTPIAISRLGIKTTNFLGSKKDLRVKESYLSTVEKILILGTIESNEGQKKIKLVGHNPFVISFLGKDALLTKRYWEVAKFILITLIGGGLLFVILFIMLGSGW
jgi:hypothetical protein